jgi:hypothetical protein
VNIASNTAAVKAAIPLNLADPITLLRFRLDGQERVVRGRYAWALAELVKAGPAGCTPITQPGPRWSGYILKLRKAGIEIETIHEMHGGAYAGHHARYVLRSPIEVVEFREAA